MLDRVSLVCVCSIKGGKGGWCPQQGWQPVRLLTIAQNHVHHSFTSAPCPTKIQIISCASPIDTIDTSPKLFALYFSSGWFQARITIWLFPRQCKEASSSVSPPSFSSLRKTSLRNTLTERWACYWLSCFKGGLQLKDSEIKVSFGFSAPLGDNFWNKHKGCAQQPRQKLVSKKYN